MKNRFSIVLFFGFMSFIISAYSIYNTVERVGNTQLNGLGCVCHSLYASPQVETWIVGLDTLLTGEKAHYKVFLRGGPAFTGGYNVAARFGTLGLLDTISILHWGELTQKMPLPFPSPTDTIFWEFTYTAPDSVEYDTLYAASLSIDSNGEPDSLDLWNFSPKFLIKILPDIVPVELTTFSGRAENSIVILNWQTASEKNNFGFEILRSVLNKEYEKIGFVKGSGTTSEQKNYSFNDDLNHNLNLPLQYRLKQIDFNGAHSYSQEIEVESISPSGFLLSQNYPNPSNPSTTISFTLPFASVVTLKLYDALGNEIAALINNEIKEAGGHSYKLEMINYKLASGIYYYKITAGSLSSVKKLIVLK